MFQETRPLALEWFGGIDSSTPPNDLAPYSAVTAENCVFPESCVGSRPGITGFASTGANSSPARSLLVVNTRLGTSPRRQLVVGYASGEGYLISLDPGYVYSTVLPCSPHGNAPLILTAGQFFERAIVCESGANGYGEWTTYSLGFSLFRFARPGPPTVVRTGGAGSVTGGQKWVALNVTFTDGSEGPLGEPVAVNALTGDLLTITPGASIPQTSDVAFASVWITTSDSETEFRRAVSLEAVGFTFLFTLADADLQRMELVNDQPRLRSAKFPALAVPYAGRVAYFGEKHRAVAGWKEGGSRGTDFGYGYGSLPGVVPPGWTVTAGTLYGLGGGEAVIRFDGVAATPARLLNLGSLVKDLPGIASLATGGWSGTFGVRIAYIKSSGAASGSLKYGVSGTTGSASATVDLAPLTANTIYVSELICTGSFSNDVKLFFEGIGPGVNLEYVTVLLCEPFDPANTTHKSTVWWTKPYAARSIDTLYGAQTFGPADGETAWLGFEWDARFYVAKDSSLWVTQKSSGHPSEWPIDKVSDLLGACGRRSIGHGPDFKILVNRAGCWLFQGAAVGTDGNLAQEIPVEWAAINWPEAWQIDVAVDEIARRVYLAVPTGTSTHNDKIYVLDYAGGFGPAGQAGGRRWSVWPLEARGITVGRRGGESTPELWVPKLYGVNNQVGYLDPSATEDWTGFNPAAISWAYETGKIGAEDGSLGLFRRLTLNAEGDGLVTPLLVKADGIPVALPAPTLYTPQRGTQHISCNVKDERVGIRLGILGTGARILLHRLALWMRRNPFGDYRARTP